MNLQAIPEALKARHQWVCRKHDKIPVNPKTGDNAQADNPDTWGTYEQAIKHYEAHKNNGIAGIGYEFSYYDPYTGLDWDKCRDPETGQLKYCAQVLIDYLDTYVEVSPSETGIHAIVKGKIPIGEGNQKSLNCGGKIEVYRVDRYFTVTGDHLSGTPDTIKNRDKELKTFHAQVIAKPKTTPTPPSPAPTLELSDQELIEKAKTAKNGDKFFQLWGGDTTGHNSPSEATAALLNHLVFWCGPDAGRIEQLFRQSGLMRPKFDRNQSGSTWGNLEIHKAIARATEFYKPPTAKASSPKTDLAPPDAKLSLGKSAEKPQAPTLKPISAKDLAAKTFSPPRWAIPDLLPEGLIILAGKPKAGKSWLALNVAVAVASGGLALGKIQVDPGEALYLALEDSERRLQERLNKILPYESFPENLHLLTAKDFPLLHKGGLEALDNWLNEHPQARLVIIDTLARVKPGKGRNQDSYDADTAIISTLQTLSIKHRLALILVHHTKKLATDDFVESVSGTFGLTGAADAIAVLIRRDRAAADAVLKITGRDVADIEKALKFYPDLGTWEILGEAQEFASSPERQDILLVLKETGPKTPAQLAKIIDKSSGAIRISLMRMKEKGEIYLNPDGSYSV